MISIEEALNIVLENTPEGLPIQMKLADALGYVLAEDVMAQYPSPAFDNSAMDGYALDHRLTSRLREGACVDIPISATVYAGDKTQVQIPSGYAAKIMTGAPIPTGVDAVIPKERVELLQGNKIRIGTCVEKHAHIRISGEEIEAGSAAIKAGVRLTPAAIGYLRSLGCFTVLVHRQPSVCIIPTGTELVRGDRPLEFGEIYETNAMTLEAAFASMRPADSGIYPVVMEPIPDDLEVTRTVLKKAVEEFEIVLICGGVSVGDKDLVKGVLGALSVEKLFWRVNQKPGKPLFFGKALSGALIFGLPGNPAASLTCFYVYVRACIEKWMGVKRSDSDFQRVASGAQNRPQFKRAIKHFNGSIEVLDHQSSHMLRSFSEANCLVVGDEVIEI